MLTTSCRLCNSTDVAEVLDLGLHPLADTFLSESMLKKRQSYYPLGLVLCKNCGYVMSTYVVSPEERYQDTEYSYDSSNSPVAVKHFEEMAEQIAERTGLGTGDLAVDIGSNVGTLLAAIKAKTGASIIGVEPSANMAEAAEQNGVPTVADFFGERAVSEIVKTSKAKVVSGTNVFNHIEGVQALMNNLDAVLTDDGQFVFETPYLVELIEKDAFDTIYLEHVSYFSVRPHQEFFRTAGFYIYHLERNRYMGGSIRVFIGKDASKENKALIEEYCALEDSMQLRDEATFAAFARKVKDFKYELCRSLYEIKAKGGSIVGVGAATKGNTLLNYCKIDSSLIDSIADTSPLKIGKYTPGSCIKIIDEKDMDPNVEYVLILPWNIADFLKTKLTHLTKAQFIVPHM